MRSDVSRLCCVKFKTRVLGLMRIWGRCQRIRKTDRQDGISVGKAHPRRYVFHLLSIRRPFYKLSVGMRISGHAANYLFPTASWDTLKCAAERSCRVCVQPLRECYSSSAKLQLPSLLHFQHGRDLNSTFGVTALKRSFLNTALHSAYENEVRSFCISSRLSQALF